MLARERDLIVVAEVGRGEDLLTVALRERPEVVVLDIALPGTVEVDELCVTLCEELPDAGILVLVDRRTSAAIGPELTRLAPRVGFLATDSSPRQLVDGIRELARGKPVLDIDIAVAALSAENNPLTSREREVLRKAVDGAPAGEIAAELFLSTGTVRNYLSSAVSKTGGRNRIEAIRIAQDAGWV
ncbi:response regulator transcription factor [Longispora fulva]|uniref:Two-component system response regulator DesR n=1 Tax=Longispora fulva TaxID=619741 RepID=A0A8J7KGS0_9ACTN|nr:response regulator transcription factor [Longispora fulva]MBG6135214.1 two-component system response regulator DesR [Longispora fulva]